MRPCFYFENKQIMREKCWAICSADARLITPMDSGHCMAQNAFVENVFVGAT